LKGASLRQGRPFFVLLPNPHVAALLQHGCNMGEAKDAKWIFTKTLKYLIYLFSAATNAHEFGDFRSIESAFAAPTLQQMLHQRCP
jgi:hypothetical protein